MVDCSQFLDGYSDYRDDLLDEEVRGRFDAHLAECCGCARYHRVVCRGVELFREISVPAASLDFRPRLQHRLFHLQDELSRAGTRASAASLVMVVLIAATLAAAAWLPVFNSRSKTPIALPPVAALAPQPPELPTVFRAGPLLLTEPSYSRIARSRYPSVFFGYSPIGSTAGAEALPAVYRP